MADVRFSRVSKSFGATQVIPELDLTIRSGEFTVLLGPSGCGKTTLLRMVAGLEDPTRGDISIGPREVTSLRPSERDIAMVFQSYALYPHLTVAENLAFPLRVKGVAKAERARQVERVSALLGLGALLDRKPRQLSGGQRQRVALGRAMVREPDVFLFDEPLSNLDASMREEMRSELIRFHAQQKKTVIYVTHDQVEAVKVGDRVKTGDVLGRLGNTGNSDAPHLHFHVMDGPSPLVSNGLPYEFDAFTGMGRIDLDDDFFAGKPARIEAGWQAGPHRGQLPLNNELVDFGR